MPKVTVIIPVYGVEKYIERCARSLFEQTLDDMQFIFVDDRSPDRSIEILDRVLEEYPARLSQTQIIRKPKNEGLPSARNTGLQIATGEYIIHCDSDDWVDVTMYEKLYNKAIEEDADMVWCDFFNTDGSHYMCKKQKYSCDREKVIQGLLRLRIWWNCWNKLIRKSIYENTITFPKCNFGEDLALTLQIAYYCKNFAYVDEGLYYYYYNPNSITLQMSDEKIESKVFAFIDNISIVDDFYTRMGVKNQLENDFVGLMIIAKLPLVSISGKRGRCIWNKVYPELSLIKVLVYQYTPLYNKILYFLYSIGLYQFFRMLKRTFIGKKQMRS